MAEFASRILVDTATRPPSSSVHHMLRSRDLIPVFRKDPSMISDEGKGNEDVEEQTHGGADNWGAEAD
jgi:hypothetical protein